MAELTNTEVAREARAERIIKKIRLYYALGQKADAYRTTHEGGHTLTAFANRKGVTSDTVRKARQFVEYYTPGELEELCKLRKPEPDGLPLNWGYVLQLLRIPNAEMRKRLQTQAAKEGWSGPELGAVIGKIVATSTSTKRSGKSRQGGRRFKRPASPEALLSQLTLKADYWNRRFEKGWTVDGHLYLDGLIDQAGKRNAAELPGRLRKAREALTRVQATAEQAKTDLQALERRLKRAKS